MTIGPMKFCRSCFEKLVAHADAVVKTVKSNTFFPEVFVKNILASRVKDFMELDFETLK